MPLQRAAGWFRRTKFSAVAKAPLGWGAEYWDADPTNYEGWSDLRDRHIALGRNRTKGRSLAEVLSRNLLDDVLAAAGGVEHAVENLRSAVQDLSNWAEEYGLKADSGMSVGLSHEAASEAWYSFADVISWARTLEERLERRPVQKAFRNQGLVPALKPVRLRRRAGTLLDQFRKGPLGETRFLTNFTLHASLVQNPNSGAQLDPSGSVRLPIPDVQTKRIHHWYMFTWEQQRDGIAFAEDLWTAVQNFIDELLAAFEDAVPKRLRRPTAP